MTLDKLQSRIDKAATKKQDLEENVAELEGENADIDKRVAEATKIRNEENEQFLKVEADFTGAAEAVDDAIEALKEYYGDASLVQTATKDGKKATGAAPPALGGAKTDSAG